MLREILKLLRKDDLMTQALGECREMLRICHTMVNASVESLRRRDTAEISADIYALDKKLNAFERDVRRKVVTHLALRNTADTAAGLTLVSIVIDLERIGDYTKNIQDLALSHPTRLLAGDHEPMLSSIEATALQHVARTVTTFDTGDVEEARKLMTEYKLDISKQCRTLETELVAGRTSLGVADAVSIALYTRFLKRISAHSRNLVSSLVNPIDRIGYPE